MPQIAEAWLTCNGNGQIPTAVSFADSESMPLVIDSACYPNIADATTDVHRPDQRDCARDGLGFGPR